MQQEWNSESFHRGTCVAQLVKRLAIGFGSGHGLTGCEVEPCNRLCAPQGVCLKFLCLCPSLYSCVHVPMLFLSQTNTSLSKTKDPKQKNPDTRAYRFVSMYMQFLKKIKLKLKMKLLHRQKADQWFSEIGRGMWRTECGIAFIVPAAVTYLRTLSQNKPTKIFSCVFSYKFCHFGVFHLGLWSI